MLRGLTLSDCWAKTDAAGVPRLTIYEHCVDVGSVALVVKRLLAPSISALFPDGGVFLTAAHDIGKISPGFLLKSPVWRTKWAVALSLGSNASYCGNHALVGQKFLANQESNRHLNWLLAIGGHHGKYPTKHVSVQDSRAPEGSRREFFELKSELHGKLSEIFGVGPIENIDKSPRLHWLTGFIIFCDWIGSNPGFFPLNSNRTPAQSQVAACEAVRSIGWGEHSVAHGKRFSEIFSFNDTAFSPSALQSAAISCADAPGLYIIEGAMGTGKTEAALGMAYRRWTEGGERGLFFALPTQLTSDQIHKRISTFMERVAANDTTLTLVHGNSWLTDKRVMPIHPSAPGEADGADCANTWFSDNRRALLAPFGVGTVDQALLAAMPVKFSALRLFALSGKVVIIDEVHSYDHYTSALIDRLVSWLRQVGATVIVLSATLSAARRGALLNAVGAFENPGKMPYPLITKVVDGGVVAHTIPVLDDEVVPKKITITHYDVNANQWQCDAAQAAADGACVLVIKNTIAGAQNAYKSLVARVKEGCPVGLIHSRFPQFLRRRNEDQWVGALGRSGERRPRGGCILIGTQILEQSIDVDADLLFTDLAPTDLLLQRIGRLHRHFRGRPSGFGAPRGCILSPCVNWQGDAQSICREIGASRFIYPPTSLYAAFRSWAGRDEIVIPAQIREIIEESSVLVDLPAGLADLLSKEKNKVAAMLGCVVATNIFQTPAVGDDEKSPQTRWGIPPQGFVVLLRHPPIINSDGICIQFLDGTDYKVEANGFSPELARRLHNNACRIPAYMLPRKALFPVLSDAIQSNLADSVLAVCRNDVVECDVVNSAPDPSYRILFHPTMGLSCERVGYAATMDDDDEALAGF